MFGKPEIEYVYTFWEGVLERAVVDSYNPVTEKITGHSDGRRFVSSMDCGIYFRTPEEAVKEDHDAIKESLVEARQEVQDALASYRAIRRIANMPFEAYLASIPRRF